jgi:hypothetical protein
MSHLFDTEQLRYTHPEAWHGLPDPYKEDDCLLFWEGDDGLLYAEAREDQVHAIGTDKYMFAPLSKVWVVIPRTK